MSSFTKMYSPSYTSIYDLENAAYDNQHYIAAPTTPTVGQWTSIPSPFVPTPLYMNPEDVAAETMAQDARQKEVQRKLAILYGELEASPPTPVVVTPRPNMVVAPPQPLVAPPMRQVVLPQPIPPQQLVPQPVQANPGWGAAPRPFVMTGGYGGFQLPLAQLPGLPVKQKKRRKKYASLK